MFDARADDCHRDYVEKSVKNVDYKRVNWQWKYALHSPERNYTRAGDCVEYYMRKLRVLFNWVRILIHVL